MVETLTKTPEFEQKNTETERKFMPIFPEQLGDLRGEAEKLRCFLQCHCFAKLLGAVEVFVRTVIFSR